MKKLISLVLAVCFLSILPFNALATEYYDQPESAKYLKSYLPDGYNPYMMPAMEDEKETWMWDANDFLDKAGYEGYEYKFDKIKTNFDNNFEPITSTLDYVNEYSVVDPQLAHLDSTFASPILLYEKEGLPALNGADTDRQLLGRSDLGVSISNVKFPLINTSWNFIEDAELIEKPYEHELTKQFWSNYTGGKELQKTPFDAALENDPEEAYKIDVLTSFAFIGQVRVNDFS